MVQILQIGAILVFILSIIAVSRTSKKIEYGIMALLTLIIGWLMLILAKLI